MNDIPVLAMTGQRAYPPRKSELTQAFWDGLAEGRFLTTRCDSCEKLTFPPKSFCPHCWSRDVRWVNAPRTGKVYAHSTVHIAPAVFAHEAPYRVCIADLDGGLRVATRLVDSDAEVPLDTPVEIVILQYEDGPLFAVRQKEARR